MYIKNSTKRLIRLITFLIIITHLSTGVGVRSVYSLGQTSLYQGKSGSSLDPRSSEYQDFKNIPAVRSLNDALYKIVFDDLSEAKLDSVQQKARRILREDLDKDVHGRYNEIETVGIFGAVFKTSDDSIVILYLIGEDIFACRYNRERSDFVVFTPMEDRIIEPEYLSQQTGCKVTAQVRNVLKPPGLRFSHEDVGQESKDFVQQAGFNCCQGIVGGFSSTDDEFAYMLMSTDRDGNRCPEGVIVLEDKERKDYRGNSFSHIYIHWMQSADWNLNTCGKDRKFWYIGLELLRMVLLKEGVTIFLSASAQGDWSRRLFRLNKMGTDERLYEFNPKIAMEFVTDQEILAMEGNTLLGPQPQLVDILLRKLDNPDEVISHTAFKCLIKLSQGMVKNGKCSLYRFEDIFNCLINRKINYFSEVIELLKLASMLNEPDLDRLLMDLFVNLILNNELKLEEERKSSEIMIDFTQALSTILDRRDINMRRYYNILRYIIYIVYQNPPQELKLLFSFSNMNNVKVKGILIRFLQGTITNLGKKRISTDLYRGMEDSLAVLLMDLDRPEEGEDLLTRIAQARYTIMEVLLREPGAANKLDLMLLDFAIEELGCRIMKDRIEVFKDDLEENIEEVLDAMYILALFLRANGLGPLALEMFAKALKQKDLTYGQLKDLMGHLSNIYYEEISRYKREYHWILEKLSGDEDESEYTEFITNLLIKKRELVLFGDLVETLLDFSEGKIDEGERRFVYASPDTPLTDLPYILHSSHATKERLEEVSNTRTRFGSKGDKLIKAIALGCPVPTGMFIPALVHRDNLHNTKRAAFKARLRRHIERLEREEQDKTAQACRFGDSDNPLLLSVRGGTAMTLKGVPETVTFVGMNDNIVEGIVKKTGSKKFAYDCYRRFLMSYADVVFDMDKNDFIRIIDRKVGERRKRSYLDLSADDVIDIVEEYKRLIENAGYTIPQDPWEQFFEAVYAVYRASELDEAKRYRSEMGVSEDWPVALAIQAMRYGNKRRNCSGVVISNGSQDGGELKGEFSYGSQPGDHVLGIARGIPISLLKDENSRAYKQLQEYANRLEDLFDSPQEIKFIIDEEGVWIIGIRNAREVYRQKFPEFVLRGEPAAVGIGAYGGAFRGIAAFDLDNIDYLQQRVKEEEVDGIILVMRSPTTERSSEIARVGAILASRGGATSDVSIIANLNDVTAVVGVEELECDTEREIARIGGQEIREGMALSIHGGRGEVFLGRVPTLQEALAGEVIGGMTKVTALPEGNIANRTVYVRVDFNVPLDFTGSIIDDKRIREALPTIRYLLRRNVKVVLMSHLGKPKGKVVPALSLRPVRDRLEELLREEARSVRLAPDSVGESVDQMISGMEPRDVVLLENLRFHEGEESNDPEYSRQLFNLAEVYVNDAFGTVHREHASMAGAPTDIPQSAGFLLVKEIQYLRGVLANPQRPFVAVLGGAKVKDKIRMIENLLSNMKKGDSLLIGGAMAYPFLVTKGVDIGNSRLDEDDIPVAGKIIETCERKGINLVLPVDHLVAREFRNDSETMYVNTESIPEDWLGIDIGRRTYAEFVKYLNTAETIFWNGPVGAIDKIPNAVRTKMIVRALSRLKKYGTTVIIGGGDTASIVVNMGYENAMSHVSTGGGASVKLLEGSSLPGVEALIRNKHLQRVDTNRTHEMAI